GPAAPPKSADDVVLSAPITEMPAPPAAGATPAAPKPRPKPKRVVPVAPAEPPATASVASLPASEPSLAPNPALTNEKPLAEVAPEALIPPNSAKTLPPRLDLAYKVFLG